MSRLEGNERWQSKMLLAEHQEQYERRGQANPAGQPTAEELTLIRDYVLLPHLLVMVQKSIQDMENSAGMLKRLYLAAAQVLLSRISEDMYSLKRELARRNIRIVGDEQVDLVLYHRFICRGYEDRFGMVREVMKAQISIRLTKYVADLTEVLRQQAP